MKTEELPPRNNQKASGRLTPEELARFRDIARAVRVDILTMLCGAGSGHTGGSLSIVELLTVLFYKKMRYRPDQPDWPDRDKLILSKGHAAPALYAFLGRLGFFPIEEFRRLRKMGGILQGHVDCLTTPGVETSTGSLGQGLSQANGLALAERLNGRATKVYVLLGDGEVEAGQVWEAAMTANHYRLDNLCAVLDWNKFQIDGSVDAVKSLSPLHEKWASFGWHVVPCDGHDFESIYAALLEADEPKDKPTIIIAETVKGKGVSFMENRREWHGIAPSAEQLELALTELSADIEEGGVVDRG